MKFLLDTNIRIYALKQHPRVLERLLAHSRSDVELKSNLVYGLHDSGGFLHPADLSLIDSINEPHAGDDVSELVKAA